MGRLTKGSSIILIVCITCLRRLGRHPCGRGQSEAQQVRLSRTIEGKHGWISGTDRKRWVFEQSLDGTAYEGGHRNEPSSGVGKNHRWQIYEEQKREETPAHCIGTAFRRRVSSRQLILMGSRLTINRDTKPVRVKREKTRRDHDDTSEPSDRASQIVRNVL